MPRPCHFLHANPLAGCHWCELEKSNPHYRALWAGEPAPPSEERPALCLHLGAVVPTADARQHFQCEKGRGVVRPCCDCGFGCCPDYEPDEPAG